MNIVRMALVAFFFLLLNDAKSNAQANNTFEARGLTKEQVRQLRALAAGMVEENKKAATDNARAVSQHPILGGRHTPQSNTQTKNAYVPSHPPSEHLRLYLRQDFQDIGIFSAAKQTSDDEAAGAEFSWARDRITHDNTWTAHGTVAAAYSYLVEDIRDPSPLIGFAIGPYYGINRELHSRNHDDNVDVKKAGLSGEVGWKNPFFEGARDYARLSLAGKRDDIKDSTVTHGTFEWLPVGLWKGSTIRTPFVNILYNWTPEFMVQYDETSERDKTIAFSGERRSLRVGPEAVLWLRLDAPTSALQSIFRKTTARIVYHWWTEWPAPGSEDTELGVLMGPEVRHGEAEVHARVQA